MLERDFATWTWLILMKRKRRRYVFYVIRWSLSLKWAAVLDMMHFTSETPWRFSYVAEVHTKHHKITLFYLAMELQIIFCKTWFCKKFWRVWVVFKDVFSGFRLPKNFALLLQMKVMSRFGLVIVVGMLLEKGKIRGLLSLLKQFLHWRSIFYTIFLLLMRVCCPLRYLNPNFRNSN